MVCGVFTPGNLYLGKSKNLMVYGISEQITLQTEMLDLKKSGMSSLLGRYVLYLAVVQGQKIYQGHSGCYTYR